jgi:Recombination endonuclease VII
VTEAPVQYASIPSRKPLPQGATCAACGSPHLLVRDHCHEHGWMRNIVCRACNAYLGYIDRGYSPCVKEHLLTALMAVRNSCPDCDPLDISGLSHKSLRSPATLGVKGPTVDSIIESAERETRA